MLLTLAISGYRSLRDVKLCVGQLNLITGPNGSGKSSIYRSLRLLSDTANGRLIQSLAHEGGLQSTLWAGPEVLSREMLLGQVPVQGTAKRRKPVSLQLGFTGDDFSYTIELGLPAPSEDAFSLDPIIKRECVWHGPSMKPRNLVVDRRKHSLRIRSEGSGWQDIESAMHTNLSVLTEYSDPHDAPELVRLRDAIRSWRFYDFFPTDADAPARRLQIGTFTPVLSNDGADLAAALETIRMIGNGNAVDESISDAFPGSSLEVAYHDKTRMEVTLKQLGMLRPLRAAELSDGTLRYLMLVAALLTPRPPELMVLNEPETSLHPDLLPALGRLIARFSLKNQVVVVTHSEILINTLIEADQFAHFRLEKTLGATELLGVDKFDLPSWKWPAR